MQGLQANLFTTPYFLWCQCERYLLIEPVSQCSYIQPYRLRTNNSRQIILLVYETSLRCLQVIKQTTSAHPGAPGVLYVLQTTRALKGGRRATARNKMHIYSHTTLCRAGQPTSTTTMRPLPPKPYPGSVLTLWVLVCPLPPHPSSLLLLASWRPRNCNLKRDTLLGTATLYAYLCFW